MGSKAYVLAVAMRFAFVCSVLLLAGCEGSRSSPTEPSPSPPAVPIYTISGVVRAGSAPVAGALITVLDQQFFAPVTTDSNGYYSIRTGHAQPWGLSPLVSASKPGYFSDIRFTDASYLPISKDRNLISNSTR